MFENRIRDRRNELGLSQTKLACRIGMAQGTLSNIELGKLQAWPKVRKNLAKVLRLSIAELFPDGYLNK